MVAVLEKKFSPVVFAILTVVFCINYGLCGSWKRTIACLLHSIAVAVISSFIPGIGQIIYLANLGLMAYDAYKIGEALEKGETIAENHMIFEFYRDTWSKYTGFQFIMGLLIKDAPTAETEGVKEKQSLIPEEEKTETQE